MNTDELPTPDSRRLVSSAWLGSVVFDFVATPEARNKITTREMAQHLIDRIESDIPHDELPPHYDWLVAQRDSLPVDCGSGTVYGVCRKCGRGHGYPVSVRPNDHDSQRI